MSDIIYIDGHDIDLDYQIPLVTSIYINFLQDGRAELSIKGTGPVGRHRKRVIGYLSTFATDALKMWEQENGLNIDNITERRFDPFDCGDCKLFYAVKFGEELFIRYFGLISRIAYDNHLDVVMEHGRENPY